MVDLREPTRSDGNNLLTLINRYMDKHRDNPRDIGAKAKAEKAELEKAILRAYPAIHTFSVAESAPTTGLNVKSMPNGVGIKTTL